MHLQELVIYFLRNEASKFIKPPLYHSRRPLLGTRLMDMILLKIQTTKRSARFPHQGLSEVINLHSLPIWLKWESRHREISTEHSQRSMVGLDITTALEAQRCQLYLREMGYQVRAEGVMEEVVHVITVDAVLWGSR